MTHAADRGDGPLVETGLTKPVLVTGLAHSGKTEVCRLLRSDPSVVVVRRAYFLRAHYGRYGDLNEEGNLAKCLGALASDESLETIGLDMSEMGARLSGRREPISYGSLFMSLLGLLPGVTSRSRLVIQLSRLEGLARHLLGDLVDATMLYMVSDPRRSLGVSPRAAWPGRRGRDLAMWKNSVTAALSAAAELPERFAIMSWEDLAANPDGAVASLASFTGLDVSARELVTSDADAKRRLLPGSFATVVEAKAGHQLAQLGYELHRTRSRRFGHILDRLGYALGERTSGAAQPW